MALLEQGRMTQPPVAAPREATDVVRVVIIDKDPLLRAGIRSIVQPCPHIEVAGDFDSLRPVSARVPEMRPDVLLVGSSHLDDQFKAALPELTHVKRAPAVVTLMQPDDQSGLRNAVMCSVRGFVDRNTSPEDLGQAVLEVHRGRTYLSSSIAEVLVDWVAMRLNREPVSLHEIEQVLTERELQVLEALGDGITNTAIARRLRIQEATVRSHTYHILNKLNLRTRTEAVLVGHGYASARQAPAQSA